MPTGGGCVDLQADPANCGMVGQRCNGSQVCTNGVCTCRPGLTANPGGGCVDLQSDPRDCGALGNACTMGQVCLNGACQPAMGGGCGGGGLQLCGAACVNQQTSWANCGGCGQACANDEICVSGQCRAYRAVPACTTCPCAQCGGMFTSCCRDPGGNPIMACVEGTRCP
jgi:hypothetical protein